MKIENLKWEGTQGQWLGEPSANKGIHLKKYVSTFYVPAIILIWINVLG